MKPALLLVLLVLVPRSSPAQETPLRIVTHENRTPAGTLAEGVLTVELETGTGIWHPEKDEGPGHRVRAFGIVGGELSIPGPLLRVPEGTELRIRIRNRLAEPLVLHGLHTRPAEGGDTLHVAAGGEREIRFPAGAPGTYHYWASTTGAASTTALMGEESQLNGAFVIDPAGGPTVEDRIFVIGVWLDPDELRVKGRFGDLIENRAVVVNGLSWPHTERFRYAVGDSIRWRWINTSDRPHPMHLHGSHFRVDSRGGAVRDTIYSEERQRLAVTETVVPEGTFTMLWVPGRIGNWLFHCHTLAHISSDLRLDADVDGRHVANHALEAMSGLVVGIEVVPGDDSVPAAAAPAPARRLRLLATLDPGRYGTEPGYTFVLDDGSGIARPRRPGPPIILTRGEPVAITVVNRLPEPTSVHWHGIELDCYFDGVSGWSGVAGRVAPSIAPGDSFVAHMTPPRAGTYIYHTHFEELRQLTSGMYGPLLVMEPGQTFDPTTDRVLLISGDGPIPIPTQFLNGRQAPEMELVAGTAYRLRWISIAPNGVRSVSLLDGDRPVSWTPLAKDGADLPPAYRVSRPAVQPIGVGETYDFAFTPETPGTLRLDVRQRGDLVISGIVKVVPPETAASR